MPVAILKILQPKTKHFFYFFLTCRDAFFNNRIHLSN